MVILRREWFEHFAQANDVPAEKEVAVFLGVIGATTYGLLRSLLAPDKPGSKQYADLVKVLHDHFSPKPIIIAERFRFHKRNREEGESVVQYVAVLKKLSEHCDFGTHLHDALRNRFVRGLSNESIQRKMLTGETLTFQRAVDISMSMETVAREAEHLKSSLKCTQCLPLHHKGEINSFAVASQIIKKVTVTTESSPAIAAKEKGTSLVCAKIKRETKSTQKRNMKQK